MKTYKNLEMIRQKGIIYCAILLGMLTLAASCKRYPDPAPVFEKYGKDSSGGLQRKVMVISIDGATGSEIKNIAPPNISALQQHSKYSYNMLRSSVATDASTWVSMITGVPYSDHLIKESSFQTTPNDSDISESEHGGGQAYFPPIFSYILQIKPYDKMAVITPWAALSHYTRIVQFNVEADGDKGVKDSTVALLGNENGLGVVYVDFRDVEKAGEAGSFSANDAGYKSAVMKTDGYVGVIMQALKNRKNFKNEDWLVIVTTNHGGSSVDPKNGFILCYNPALQEQEVMKHGFNTVAFNNFEIHGEVPDDQGLYDAGTNKDFTVQLQIKFNSTNYWPGFFSKSTSVQSHSMTGWFFQQNSLKWDVLFGGASSHGTGGDVKGADFNEGHWHTVTMTVKTQGGQRIATTYNDGEKIASGDISGKGSLSTSEGLRIGYKDQDQGYGTSHSLSFNAADIEYFNKALDAQTIEDNIDLKDITKHPDYGNLTGYWPLDDGTGGVLSNEAPGGYDMILSGPYTWVSLKGDVPVSMTPDSSDQTSVIPVIQDIPAILLYWIKIEIKDDWKIKGIPWLDNFEKEIFGIGG